MKHKSHLISDVSVKPRNSAVNNYRSILTSMKAPLCYIDLFKSSVKLTLALVLISVLGSCDRSAIISETSNIEGGLWNSEDIKEFNFVVEDTLMGNNFYVLIRNNEKYPYRNLYLFINLEFDDKIVRDTVYCTLANTEGKWLGTGIGDHHNSEILYKRNQRFPELGPYKISIEQGMREEDIIGITDIGISILKNN